MHPRHYGFPRHTVRKLTLLPAFSSQRNKQCKLKVLELISPSEMFATIVFAPTPSTPLPQLLFFVSEMKGNPGKLSKPLVIMITETKQRI